MSKNVVLGKSSEDFWISPEALEDLIHWDDEPISVPFSRYILPLIQILANKQQLKDFNDFDMTSNIKPIELSEAP